jgi:hypothetical protein
MYELPSQAFLLPSISLTEIDMGLLSWLQGLFSTRAKSLAMYRAGVAKANKKDYRGAIADYTEAIGSPDIPSDVKGMALYNRALAYAAIDDDVKAADDLAALLKIPGLPENIATQARRRRERLRRRSEDSGGPAS